MQFDLTRSPEKLTIEEMYDLIDDMQNRKDLYVTIRGEYNDDESVYIETIEYKNSISKNDAEHYAGREETINLFKTQIRKEMEG